MLRVGAGGPPHLIDERARALLEKLVLRGGNRHR